MEMEEHSLHESEESEQQRWQRVYGDITFVDDVHGGKLLKRDKVIEARKIEMEYFRKMRLITGQDWLDASSTLTKEMTYSHQPHLWRR